MSVLTGPVIVENGLVQHQLNTFRPNPRSFAARPNAPNRRMRAHAEKEDASYGPRAGKDGRHKHAASMARCKARAIAAARDRRTKGVLASGRSRGMGGAAKRPTTPIGIARAWPSVLDDAGAGVRHGRGTG